MSEFIFFSLLICILTYSSISFIKVFKVKFKSYDIISFSIKSLSFLKNFFSQTNFHQLPFHFRLIFLIGYESFVFNLIPTLCNSVVQSNSPSSLVVYSKFFITPVIISISPSRLSISSM